MAAGNWLSSAGIGDALNAVTARTIQVALHESEKNGEAIAHPVMQAMLARDSGMGNLVGALGLGVSFAAIGQGKLIATAEEAEATASNFSTANVAVTPARRAYARKVSDYARSLQDGLLAGELSPNAYALLVYEGFRVWGNSVVDVVVALASSASNEIGTTGTALTWSALQDGVMDLKDRGAASGSALALVTAKGAKDLANDALSLGGAVQMATQTQSVISNAATGAFVGRMNGVDVYLNSELDTDGGDTLGILLTDGAIMTKHQQVPLPREADALVNAGFFTQELRRPGGGISTVETVAYFGAAVAEQGRYAAIRYAT